MGAREAHQVVVGGVELDLVVAAQLRRVLVREPPPLERLAGQRAAECGATLGRRRAAFALERLDERPVLGEEIVARERRRLVHARRLWESRHRAMRLRLHDIGGSPRSRVLVVLDGPEYQRQMRLVALLRRLVERGDIRPHRLALVEPDERRETYSASAAYARALASEVAPLGSKRVGIGSSLGGLALLHAHRLQPSIFEGLFLQSGSYFRRRTDPQEARFGRFGRIDRFVGTGCGSTTITCAFDEENYDNNAAVAKALAAQGYPIDFHAARGGHDWPTWKRALQSHLPALLRSAWR